MPRAFSFLLTGALVAAGTIALLLILTATPTRKPPAPVIPKPAPLRKFDVVAEYPHDPNALTQGLIYAGGFLYESTGREGQSSIRKVDLKTGQPVQRREVDNRFLGEGLTEWQGQLLQLTPPRANPTGIRYVMANNGFLRSWFGGSLDFSNGVRYSFNSLKPNSRFYLVGAGWGLTHDDRELIMSDGTSMLRFVNPDTMEWQGQIGVTDNGQGIRWLNELEFVHGKVYANIWQQDRIAIIRPDSGEITEWLDLSELRPRLVPPPQDVEGLGAYGKAVANGIAYDAAKDRLFVTGKNWPRLFEIRLRH